MAMRMRIWCLSEMCAAYIALYPTYVGLCGSMRIGKYIRMANPNINGPHTVYPFNSLVIQRSSFFKFLSTFSDDSSQTLNWQILKFKRLVIREVSGIILRIKLQSNVLNALYLHAGSVCHVKITRCWPQWEEGWVCFECTLHYTTLHIGAMQCIVVYKLSSLQIQNRAFNEACIYIVYIVLSD